MPGVTITAENLSKTMGQIQVSLDRLNGNVTTLSEMVDKLSLDIAQKSTVAQPTGLPSTSGNVNPAKGTTP